MLFFQLTGRQIRRSLSLGATTWIWIVATPLLLLAVYAFVFGVIFQARVPAGLDVPFVGWLAVALWPWLAFSDGVLRGAGSIRSNAALISKVAVPRAMLATSTQTAAFLLQLMGYAVVLVVLMIAGIPLHLQAVPYLLLLLTVLFVFSFGLALFFAAVQVFVRDLEQLLPTLFLFWFFLTPILYAPDMLPGDSGRWLLLNPMTWWMEEIRAALFEGKWLPDLMVLVLILIAGAATWIGHLVFDRLSPHFEDFL